MQGFIALVLILGFVSPCLCTRLNVGTENAIYNVIQYGARGDGKTDDSQVDVSLNFFYIIFINISLYFMRNLSLLLFNL